MEGEPQPVEHIFLSSSDELVIQGELGLDKENKPKNASSRVYKGYWVPTRLEVFVKHVHIDNFGPWNLQNLIVDAKTLHKIHHPNIFSFLGAIVEPHQALLVTELLEKDLSDALTTEPGLTLHRKLRIARQICLGMVHLHKIGVVHNDLKLDNIMLDKNGTVKITDFGFARAQPQHMLGNDFHASGMRFGGSPQYKAPERLLRLLDHQGNASDVYSFGIILWEIAMDNKKSPYQDLFIEIQRNLPQDRTQDDFVNAFIRCICEGARPPMLPAAIPMGQQLYSIMQMCWATDPSQRPTFLDLVAYIDALIVDATIPDPVGAAMWKANFTDTTQPWAIAKEEVTWDEFRPHFFEAMGYDRTDDEANRMVSLTFEVLTEKDKNDPKRNVVTLERFGKLVEIYGPLRKRNNHSPPNNNDSTMLEKIFDSCYEDYFLKDLNQEQAFEKLKHEKIGTFLLRLSAAKNCFTFSVVLAGQEKNSTKVVSYRVNHDLEKGYWIWDGTPTYPSIQNLIEASKDIFKYPYAKVHRNRPAEGNAVNHNYEHQ